MNEYPESLLYCFLPQLGLNFHPESHLFWIPEIFNVPSKLGFFCRIFLVLLDPLQLRFHVLVLESVFLMWSSISKACNSDFICFNTFTTAVNLLSCKEKSHIYTAPYIHHFAGWKQKFRHSVCNFPSSTSKKWPNFSSGQVPETSYYYGQVPETSFYFEPVR